VDYEYTGWQTLVSLGDYVKYWGPEDVTEAKAKHYNEHWFPMINLKVKPIKWLDVRAAYTELAQRHGYQHLVPSSIERVTATRLDVGNPYLKPQISENWDLYLTTYSNKLGLFSAGIFHKKIKNGLRITDWYLATPERAEEWGLDDSYKGYTYYIPANKKYPGFSKGLELEWQTNFWYLPFPFNALVLNANYTRQINDGKTPYFIYDTKTISIRPPVFETTQTDTFYSTHQVRDLVNISLGYDYKGFAGYVSYFYQGRSVQNFDPKEYLNVWTFPYSRVDIKIRQKLPVKGLEFFFDANNITESGDRNYRHSEAYIDYEEFWGRTFNWGLRYRM
jgi:TonB-dependent receptor